MGSPFLPASRGPEGPVTAARKMTARELLDRLMSTAVFSGGDEDGCSAEKYLRGPLEHGRPAVFADHPVKYGDDRPSIPGPLHHQDAQYRTTIRRLKPAYMPGVSPELQAQRERFAASLLSNLVSGNKHPKRYRKYLTFNEDDLIPPACQPFLQDNPSSSSPHLRRKRQRVEARTRADLDKPFDAIMWDAVLGVGEAKVDAWRTVPKEVLAVRPSDEVIARVDKLNEFDPDRITLDYMDVYLAWVSCALRRVRAPDGRHEWVVRCNRRKLGVVLSEAAKVAAGMPVSRGSEAYRQGSWKLGVYQELAGELAWEIWWAGDMKEMETEGPRVRYLEGFPVGMGPEIPRVLPSGWRSRAEGVRWWSACVQCEEAAVRECTGERALSKHRRDRTCGRCKRLGLPCVRLKPSREDDAELRMQDLGAQRQAKWYRAADKLVSQDEIKDVVEQCLEKRGKKLVNICGLGVDAEDVKCFALPRKPDSTPAAHTLETTTADVGGAVDIFGRSSVSSQRAAQAESFAERMQKIRGQGYWQEQGARFGRGMDDSKGRKSRVIREPWTFDREPIPAWLHGI